MSERLSSGEGADQGLIDDEHRVHGAGSRAGRGPSGKGNSWSTHALLTASMTLGVLAVTAGYAHQRFGSIGVALAYVGGERLSIDDASKSLGRVVPDREYEVDYRLTNHARRPVTIVGMRASCGCTSAGDLPLTIPPGATRSLVVNVNPRRSNGPTVHLELFTDDPHEPARSLSATFRLTPDDNTTRLLSIKEH